ncbi:hypothetical protein K450DRAFT_254276 [Umbelopsis ramanniana AG]|uniref:Uncharacterized protein n=1 Tax=Umbelopsis ramanniana AG TaxID=1314678 RepID=A0AAD5HBW9_UMBRA|nr:uncharacterized protein K450DRAFT_254276 [Umbelopsis ramanniana AG]KAI8576931.1 hypothetical protein K450DRAFT_254276 [Umbelopsis ramanniana AG]
MADGKSIVIYGGYDGYNVFNDVAILHTDTWTWEVKSTTANVQGRADHSATLIGTNMIVAFGFTGVSTSLSILSDIENLDVSTWSWRSVFNTSSDITKGQHTELMSGPSPGVIVGAVAGLAALFCILLIALHLCNRRYNQKHNDDDESLAKETNSLHEVYNMAERDESNYGDVLSSLSDTTISPITLARRGGKRIKRNFTDGVYNPTSPTSFHRFFSTPNMNDLPHSKRDSHHLEILSPDSPLEELHEATVEAKVPQILHIGQQPAGLVATTAKIDRPYSTFDGEEFILMGGGDERMMSPVSESAVDDIPDSVDPSALTSSTPKGKERLSVKQSNDDVSAIQTEVIYSNCRQKTTG